MIEFTNLIGGTKTDAKFISSDYFRLDAYMSMLGLEVEHPLARVKALVDKLDTNFITIEEFAEHTLFSYSQIEPLLLELSNQGYILYNYDEGTFIVKDKLINWVNADLVFARINYSL